MLNTAYVTAVEGHDKGLQSMSPHIDLDLNFFSGPLNIPLIRELSHTGNSKKYVEVCELRFKLSSLNIDLSSLTVLRLQIGNFFSHSLELASTFHWQLGCAILSSTTKLDSEKLVNL